MSIRLQIDLALAWVYFKDHHVEWGGVQATGDGFKTKKELLDYLRPCRVRYSFWLAERMRYELSWSPTGCCRLISMRSLNT